MPPARNAASSLFVAVAAPNRLHTAASHSQPTSTVFFCSFLYPTSALRHYEHINRKLSTHTRDARSPWKDDACGHVKRTLVSITRKGEGRWRPPPIQCILRRSFHTTNARRATVGSNDDAIDNARNHYETLKLSPSASASEIKKSFYTLSKTHHPDLQPPSDRAAASKRFMRISEAYAILSNPTKKSKYDRDNDFSRSAFSSSGGGRQPGTSYHSSHNPAGGRPPSGLSRRRGTFQGPPPSFYRSGGWGAHGERRRAAHEESTGTGSSTGGNTGPASGGAGSSTAGGMGPGQDPFHSDYGAFHFDREAHERRQSSTASSQKKKKYRAENINDPAFDGADPDATPLSMFFVIGGMITFAMMASAVATRVFSAAGASDDPRLLKRATATASDESGGGGAGSSKRQR